MRGDRGDSIGKSSSRCKCYRSSVGNYEPDIDLRAATTGIGLLMINLY